MGRKVRDLIGQRFGRLVAIERAPNKKNNPRAQWLCQCDCGNRSIHASRHLVGGNAQSCGCRQIDMTIERSTTHGVSKDPRYKIWQQMMNRCYNKENHAFWHYGKRGIRVFKDWHDPVKFIQAIGDRPSPDYSLDRRNNDGNYEPNNIRWATNVEQVRNRRTTKIVRAFGAEKPLAQFVEEFGVVSYKRAHRRTTKLGWCPACAVSISPRGGKCTHR